MAVDKKITYQAALDDSAFAAGVQRVRSQLGDTDNAVGGLFSGMTAQFGKLGGMIASVTALLAGGAAFRASVEATKEFTGEANKLARVFGITATEASTLNVALSDIYADSETFAGAASKLARQLRENEGALNAMGLRTREASGEFRPLKDLMLDSIQVVNGYKQGIDRNLAATLAWGKGADEAAGLLKLNNAVIEEAKAKQQALGLVVGVENVQALARFKAAQNDIGDVFLAIKKVIGDAVMPVLTKVSNWFSTIGPAAVTIIKGAIGGLVSVFWALKNGITVVWEVANGLVVSLGESLRVTLEAIGRAMKGDFAGAVAVLQAGSKVISAVWDTAMAEMLKSSEETSKEIGNLFNPATAIAPVAQTGKGFKGPGAAKEAPKAAPSSYMAYYEGLLAEEKHANAVLTEGREYNKAQEAEFWRALLSAAQLTAADRVAVLRKIAEAEVAISVTARKQREAIEREDVDAARDLALSRLAGQQEAARAAVQLGQLTQEQLLALEFGYEDERYQIRRNALLARLALLERDPEASPAEMRRLKNDLLLVEAEYQRARQEAQRALQLEQQQPALNVWAAAERGMQAAGEAILNRTQSLRGALASVWAGIRGAITAEIAKILVAKVAAFAREKVLTIAGIGLDAAKAGSGAAASQAAIPFVGPVLALAAMAAVTAAVLGSTKGLPSAAQGWRVPHGANPIAQLHEDEMVLSSKHTKVIDDLAEGGGGAGGNVAIHIASYDAAGVRRLFMDHPDELAKGIEHALRNFHLKR